MKRVNFLTSSPVHVTQRELIALSGRAKIIPLEPNIIRSLQAGSYLSQFKGRGMEFDESRPYQPGDDPRNIDWRVTARSNQAYTKLFREERERPVYIMTDLRSNMHFATQGSFKSVIASYSAACISWAANHRGDRLGGIIYGDNNCQVFKPKLGRQAALRYLHKLTDHPGWKTSFTENDSNQEIALLNAIISLRKIVRPGSLIIIVSDFLGFSQKSHSYLARLSQYNDILAIFINDPIEEKSPPPGKYRLIASKNDILIDTHSKQARNDYSNSFKLRRSMLFEFFSRYGINYINMTTKCDPIESLISSLQRKNI